jgi:hypothetical protein
VTDEIGSQVFRVCKFYDQTEDEPFKFSTRAVAGEPGLRLTLIEEWAIKGSKWDGKKNSA